MRSNDIWSKFLFVNNCADQLGTCIYFRKGETLFYKNNHFVPLPLTQCIQSRATISGIKPELDHGREKQTYVPSDAVLFIW